MKHYLKMKSNLRNLSGKFSSGTTILEIFLNYNFTRIIEGFHKHSKCQKIDFSKSINPDLRIKLIQTTLRFILISRRWRSTDYKLREPWQSWELRMNQIMSKFLGISFKTCFILQSIKSEMLKTTKLSDRKACIHLTKLLKLPSTFIHPLKSYSYDANWSILACFIP